MATENIEKVIERTYDEIAQFGNGKLEFETSDIERITKLAESYIKLTEKIAIHQLEEDSDLVTIAELVLNETGMWQ